MAVPHHVEVRGEGVAGATIAALLFARGIAVTRVRNPAGAGPGRIVAVPMASVELLASLWDIAPGRLFGGRLVTSRQVAWESRVTTAVAFPALVCDTAVLAARLAAELDARGVPATIDQPPKTAPDSFTVLATGSARRTSGAIAGGSRIAIIGWTEHLAGFELSSIAVKAFNKGWLFAAPHPQAGVALMLVRPSPHTVTSSAEALADAVAEVFGNEAAMPHIETTGSVACAPALAPAVVAGGLAIGDAILSLDPSRGDGVGFAARGALLAQAVIAAEAGPGALRHYSARLATVFVQHVEITISHYRSSFNAPLWAAEIAAMEIARAKAAACIRGHTFSFSLDGKDLHPGAGVSWNDPAGRSHRAPA